MAAKTRVVCTRCRKRIGTVDAGMSGDLEPFFSGRRHGTSGAVEFPCSRCGANWREPMDRLAGAFFDAWMTGSNVVELPLPR